MKIIPLGVNGLYATDVSPTSCYLLTVRGKVVIIDFGSGALASLQKYIPPEKIDLIILSHFHFDHVSDMGTLGYYMQSHAEKLKVLCPFDEARAEFFSLPSRFDVSYIKEGKRELFDGVSAEFFLVRHPIETFAVKITDGTATFSYTADTNVCPALDDLFRGSDLVISDSAFLNASWSEKKPHLSAALCAEYAKKYSVRTLLTHFDPKTDRSLYLAEALSVTDKCELAEVGKIYEIR